MKNDGDRIARDNSAAADEVVGQVRTREARNECAFCRRPVTVPILDGSCNCARPEPWTMLNDAGVSPDERAPWLTAAGMGATNDGRGVFRPLDPQEDKLAVELASAYLGAAPGKIVDMFGMRAVAREVLRRFPVPVELSTAGDRSLAAEVTALRSALADAEEQAQAARGALAENASEGVDFERCCRNVVGARDNETTPKAIERVVNEREAWRMRALTAEPRANEEKAELRYLLDGARAKLAWMTRQSEQASRAAEWFAKREDEQNKRAVAAERDRDEARFQRDHWKQLALEIQATLAAVRKALGGGAA